jgi:uncharacterized protein (TIRG00374 family)
MICALVSTPPDPPLVPPSAGRWYQVWRVGRFVLALALAGVAVWVVTGKTDELSGASDYLAHVRWGFVVAALAAEALSYVAYASLQRRLLLAGKVQVRSAPMIGISLAGNSIQNSLPGGLVFYAAYVFRQYRRFGADDVLAGWTLVAANGLSFIALSALAAVGLGLALGAGSALDLVETLLGIMVLAGLLVLAWVERARILPRTARFVRLSQRWIRRPSPSVPADQIIDGWLGRLGTVSPSPADWAWSTTMGISTWVLDCGCLALSFLAVGAGVPWRGLLLAYGAGQLAAILPITPGGLGVVEGSLTVALVAFGGAENSTVAAVLLYRLMSFWLAVPVGWGAWGVLALVGRSHRSVLETSQV